MVVFVYHKAICNSDLKRYLSSIYFVRAPTTIRLQAISLSRKFVQNSISKVHRNLVKKADYSAPLGLFQSYIHYPLTCYKLLSKLLIVYRIFLMRSKLSLFNFIKMWQLTVIKFMCVVQQIVIGKISSSTKCVNWQHCPKWSTTPIGAPAMFTS